MVWNQVELAFFLLRQLYVIVSQIVLLLKLFVWRIAHPHVGVDDSVEGLLVHEDVLHFLEVALDEHLGLLALSVGIEWRGRHLR
jgi:hypothetical protein